MQPGTGNTTTAVICNRDGFLTRVVQDDLGLCPAAAIGGPFDRLVDASEAQKAQNFLAALRLRRALFDWEINAPIAGGVQTLHFAGTAADDRFCIVIGRTKQDLSVAGSALLFGIAGEHGDTPRDRVQDDGSLFDELSRLNNELVNLQRQLVQQNRELEQLNEEKNRLLGMAAHDLRNPIGAVLNCSRFLEDDLAGTLRDEQRELLSMIASTSEFMLDLVNDLLDFSKVEAGRLDLDLKPTSFADLVQESVSFHAVLAARKAIRIDFRPDAHPWLRADAGKLKQVVSNLIGNAVKFSPRGTMVRVDLTELDGQVRRLGPDQGPGIAEQDLPTLFHAFISGSVKPTGDEKSTGLGLAIAKRIVEAHRGVIWAANAAGGGAVFGVSLPAAF